MSQADLHLIHNGRLWSSGVEDNSWMVFDRTDGYIREVGRGEAPVSRFTQERRTNCQGHRVFPGFHEAHIHVSSIGLKLSTVNLSDCRSIQDLQGSVKKYGAENKECKWLLGCHWDQNRLGRMPTKEDLDICADRPILLYRDCSHIAVANSKALEIAGLDASSESPAGASIDKYPAGHPLQGQLTGVLREDGALDFITNHIEFTSQEKQAAIRTALDICLSHGVTAAHSNDAPDIWIDFRELAHADLLPIRVFAASYFRAHEKGPFPTPGERHGDMLSCDRVKIFSDGALGSSTAALSRNYVGTDNKGLLLHSQEELTAMVKEATGLGFRLEVHAIGDAGAEATLNAFESTGVAPQKRPLLTHAQILRPDLISRMRAGGVVGNIQPQFVNTDGLWLDKQLPPDLLQSAYVWKTLLREGIVCSGGSDAPVEEPRPLLGIYDSIFRRVGPRNPDNKNQFKPEEALTVQEAVDLYTIGGAYATCQEHRLGQLRAGFQADFVVLQGQDDPVSDPELFASVKVGEVWVAGKKRL